MTTREAEIQRRTALSETRVAKAVFPPTTNPVSYTHLTLPTICSV